MLPVSDSMARLKRIRFVELISGDLFFVDGHSFLVLENPKLWMYLHIENENEYRLECFCFDKKKPISMYGISSDFYSYISGS